MIIGRFIRELGKRENPMTLSAYSVSLNDSTLSTTVTIYNAIGTVTAQSASTSTATVTKSGNTLTIKGINTGSTTITVTASGNDSYNPISKTIAVSVSIIGWEVVKDGNGDPVSLLRNLSQGVIYAGLHPYNLNYGEHIFFYQSGTLDVWNKIINGAVWMNVNSSAYPTINPNDGDAVAEFNGHPHMIFGNKHVRIIYSSSSTHWYGDNTYEELTPPPYNFIKGAMVVCQNRLHILGGLQSGSTWYSYHYSIGNDQNDSWRNESTLPSTPNVKSDIKAVVLNNEIHAFGTIGTHAIWNGSAWRNGGAVPSSSGRNAIYVVYKNELHCLGGDNKHYVWSSDFDGVWYRVTPDLPISFSNGKAVVCDNTLYLLGGNGANNFYKYLR